MSEVINFPRFRRKMEDEMLVAATRSMMIDVFLDRRASIFKTLCTVSVSFNSRLEADEFYKLLVRRGKRKV